MEKSNEKAKNMEDVLLPGFRFHPTDEELVSFYLKRKVEHRPLSIKLITQLDIYKYDPWNLPKFAMTGEKEWYFYCPRDRKYRNSTRPNRVTSAGFWKATGTDRPIYSSEGNKCIGLRKSLVFYRGRAAKAIKTDWMMHEFRLPSSLPSHNLFDTPVSPNDSWAICRISKKTNTTALRTISHSFVSSTPQEARTDKTPCKKPSNTAHVSSSKASNYTSINPFFDLELTSSDSLSLCQDQQYLGNLLLAPQQTQAPPFPIFINSDNDMISSYLLNMSSSSSDSSLLGGYTNVDFACAMLAQEQCPALVSLPQEYHETSFEENMMSNVKQDHNHAMCHLSSTTVEDQCQEQKQNMLLETYYSSLSSISDDLPASFSIT